MDDQNKIELLEKFLAGSLNKEEKELFDSLIESDSTFKKEVDFQKDLQEDLAGESFHAFRETLKSADKSVQAAKPEARIRKLNSTLIRNIAGIAAGFLLIFFVYRSFDQPGALNSGEIYASNLEDYPMLLNQRTIDTSSFSITLQKAIESYQLKEYSEASENFKLLSEQNPEVIAYQFYYGISNLFSGNLGLAEPILASLEQTEGHLFIEQSRWYLALLFIKKDQTGQAITILEKINPDQFKYDEGQKILKHYK